MAKELIVENFWNRLRRETRQEHSLSNSIVNLALPFALSDTTCYIKFAEHPKALESFFYIYSIVEQEFDKHRRSVPKIGALYFPELLRTKNCWATFTTGLSQFFEKDLEFFLGFQWRTKLEGPSPVVLCYIEHIRETCSRKPWLILAYVTTLYMALFRGGSILRSILSVSLHLDKESGDGVAIYDFSETVTDTESFFKKYVETVNALTLTDEQKEEIIEEKRNIFRWNNKVLNDIFRSPLYKSVIKRFILAVIFVCLVVATFLKKLKRW
eukprot:jgi/Galph1/3775/GphlegSOOS_G2430.1